MSRRRGPERPVELYDDDGQIIKLPMHRIVCPSCDGEGKYVNPAIDGNGITGSEMAELGDDFREDYFSGFYDIQCEECHGRNVVDVVDEDALTPDQQRRYYEYLEDMANTYHVQEQERRMGA